MLPVPRADQKPGSAPDSSPQPSLVATQMFSHSGSQIYNLSWLTAVSWTQTVLALCDWKDWTLFLWAAPCFPKNASIQKSEQTLTVKISSGWVPKQWIYPKHANSWMQGHQESLRYFREFSLSFGRSAWPVVLQLL